MGRKLNKQHDGIKLHLLDINNHFTFLAFRLTRRNKWTIRFYWILHTNYDEFRKILLGIKNNCFTGHDDIPIRQLKPVVDDVTSPMVCISNTCIDNRVFPSTWKIALLCPVLKVDNAKDVTEFRPISILSILSKVFERVILHHLCHFLEAEAHYNQTQSGFRKGHSATTLLVK